MDFNLSLAERIRRGDPIPWFIGAPLTALTPLPQLGMLARRMRPATKVEAQVISFGNITAGGTGKTPAVIERAEQEVAAGHQVAILTRGYGTKSGPEPVVVTPETPREKLADKIGDEPALIAQRVPGCYIVKAARRVAGARAAIELGCDTLILDDGYQHVALARDENILVIDATNPFGNGHLVPRGILREPVSAMKRATSVMLTHCDQVTDTDALEKQVKALCGDIPIRRTRHAPSRLWRVSTGEELPLNTLEIKTVTALCAIGNPEGFFMTVEYQGAQIMDKLVFRDHAQIPTNAIPTDRLVITTEKDAVRLQEVGDNVLALGISLEDV